MTGLTLAFRLLALATALSLPAASARAADVIDPHGKPDACGSCHPATADGSLGAPSLEPAACRECHPTADMHPVGVRAVEAIIPEGWPALDGTMVCATCHADPGCSPGRMPEPMYLRGGPFPSTREFCQVCHEPRAYTRADPHHPERVRDPEDHTCAACHVRPPTETDDALRGTADETCRVCHEGAVHGGTAEHMGVAPDPVPTGLPLVDGRIGCVTCHEVHDATAPPPPPSRLAEALRVHATTTDWAGLLPQDIAWPGTPRAEHPPMLALPLHDDALCGACHGEGPQ